MLSFVRSVFPSFCSSFFRCFRFSLWQGRTDPSVSPVAVASPNTFCETCDVAHMPRGTLGLSATPPCEAANHLPGATEQAGKGIIGVPRSPRFQELFHYLFRLFFLFVVLSYCCPCFSSFGVLSAVILSISLSSVLSCVSLPFHSFFLSLWLSFFL